MTSSPTLKYRFEQFEFDLERRALYFNGGLTKVEKKALDVLTVLIREPNKLIPTQEIIDEVWAESPHGITSVHVAQSVAKLRKVFAHYVPDGKFIENVKGNGYVFSAETEIVVEPTDRKTDAPEIAELAQASGGRRLSWLSLAAGGLTVVALLLVAGWMLYPSGNDDAEIRRLIEESQKYESLVLYRDPESFQESDLDRYWTADFDPGSNYDRRDIRAGVRKLIEDGRYYGSETKNEQFEFQSVEINATGDMAVVRTLEKWFIAEYRKDSSLLRNRYVGPYFVSYIVRKVDGRWLIEDSTTARANPPAPVLSAIQPVTEIVPGQQFFVDVTGSSFIPTTVFLKVIGPGCPDTSPCTVPNSALRLHSDLAETKLSNVPLTLAPGEFTIYAQNGESSPSNALTLMVK